MVDNGVHIWDDYPYKLYKEKIAAGKVPDMTKEAFIEKIKSDNKYAKKFGNLPRIYGELWRRWPASKGRTIDQVKWVIDEMKDDPDAHNLIVTSWNPEYLYGMALPKNASRFPICHNMYQLNVKDGRVHLHLYQRSADIFLGVPFNIASYALLTLIFAQVTGNKPGEFIHTFGDVHIYENHIEAAKEQLKRKPKKFPRVAIDSKVKNVDDFRPEHVTLENYEPHPPIRGELTVSGGYFSKTSPRISMIAAIDKEMGIGKAGKIPWHIPEDMKWFKEKTLGHVVIMGKNTFTSLGKPLPGRTNIVVSDTKLVAPKGVFVVNSLGTAISLAEKKEKNGEIFFIGGGQLYASALRYTSRLYLTQLVGAFGADTFFPNYKSFTKLVFSKKGRSADYKYEFRILEKT